MSVLISNLNTIESVKLDIKSAIEAKGVSMSGVSFPDYPSAIASISGGGGGYTQKDITQKSYRIVNLNNSASFVGGYAFYLNLSIETVNLPNCLQVGMSWTTQNSAFAQCTFLQTVNLPICFYINEGAFWWCSNLSYISIPSCQYIGSKAFQSCSSLSSLDLPECISISNSAFQNCTSLSQINLPKCENIGNSAFQKCTSLSQINLPKCENIGSWCFAGTNLESITLLSTSVCSLANTNVFTSTPISMGTGSIYVPASLVSDYKIADKWSAYASRIFAIPELAFDSTTGLLYGTASRIYWEFESSLGISLTDVLAVSLSQCTSVGAAAFRGCTNLSTVTLDSCDYIGDGAFTSTGLQTLHLGGSNVCQVDSWGPNIDSNTFVSLYVPSSLVTSYETASYWSNFSTKIVPIQ